MGDVGQSADVDRLVEVAYRQVQVANFPRLPWEDAGLTSLALGVPAVEAPPMPVCTYALRPRTAQPCDRGLPYVPEVAAKRRRITARVVEKLADEKRAAAISKVFSLLEINLESCALGRQVAQLQVEPDAAERIEDMLNDVLASRATATIDKRASSLLLFVRWHRLNVEGERAMPPTEPSVYEYLRFLRATDASPSRASSALEALAFARYVLGFDCAEAQESLRCRGAAHRMLLAKRPRSPKDALEPVWACVLETAAVFERDVVRRAVYGFLVFLLYGRLRAADGGCVAGLDVAQDGKLVEGVLLGIKTSKTKEKRTTFLPTVVPLEGLTGLDWFAHFVNARAELGLPEVRTIEVARSRPVNEDIPPLMPGVLVGGLGRVSLSADEATGYLCECLAQAGVDDSKVAKVASHSLKSSCLTYVGMRGGAQPSDRQLLGHHVPKGEGSAANYNRDNLSIPFEILTDTLQELKVGTFRPDKPRGARRVPPSAGPVPISAQVEEVLGVSVLGLASVFAGRDVSLDEFKEAAFGTEAGRSGAREESDSESTSSSGAGSSSEERGEEGSSSVDSDLALSSSSESLSHVPTADTDGENLMDMAAELCGVEGAGGAERPGAGRSEQFFRHITRKTVHRVSQEAGGKFKCGRACTDKYQSIAEVDPEMLWPLCGDCF